MEAAPSSRRVKARSASGLADVTWWVWSEILPPSDKPLRWLPGSDDVEFYQFQQTSAMASRCLMSAPHFQGQLHTRKLHSVLAARPMCLFEVAVPGLNPKLPFYRRGKSQTANCDCFRPPSVTCRRLALKPLVDPWVLSRRLRVDHQIHVAIQELK